MSERVTTRTRMVTLAPRIAALRAEVAGLALLAAIYLGSEWLVLRFRLPIPSGIVGAFLLIVLLLLTSAVGSPRFLWVNAGADRLLMHLALLFSPAALLALKHRVALTGNIGKIALIVVVSSVVGLAVTTLTAWLVPSNKGVS